MRMRWRLLSALILVLVPLLGAAQASTVAVTGHFIGISGAVPENTFVRFTLINCGASMPREFGVGTVVETTKAFVPDTAGLFSGTLIPNDYIDCGGTTGNTRYSVQFILRNVPQGPGKIYNVIAGTTFNLDTAIAVGSLPPANSTSTDFTFHSLTVTSFFNLLGAMQVSGSPGLFGQCFVSSGAGAAPHWAPCAGGGTVSQISGATSGGFAVSVANPTSAAQISVAADSSHYLPSTTDQTSWNAKASLNAANFWANTQALATLGTAVSGTNYGSNKLQFLGSYYSAGAQPDIWEWKTTFPFGDTSSVLSLVHTTANPAYLQLPQNTSITGLSASRVPYSLGNGTISSSANLTFDGVTLVANTFAAKLSNGLASAQQYRTNTTTAADGCKNYITGAGTGKTCYVGQDYTGAVDGGFVATSSAHTYHIVDQSQSGQYEVYANTTDPFGAYTSRPDWARRSLLYSDNQMPGGTPNSNGWRFAGGWDPCVLAGKGRDENASNSGGETQWAVAHCSVTDMYKFMAGIAQRDFGNIYCIGAGDCVNKYVYVSHAGTGNIEGSGEGVYDTGSSVEELSYDTHGVILAGYSGTGIAATKIGTSSVQALGVRMMAVNMTTTPIATGSITNVAFQDSFYKVTTDTTLTPSQWVGRATLNIFPAANANTPASNTVTFATQYGSSTMTNGSHVCVAATISSAQQELTVSNVSVSGGNVTFDIAPLHGLQGITWASQGSCMALDATRLHVSTTETLYNMLPVVAVLDTHNFLVGFWAAGQLQTDYISFLTPAPSFALSNITRATSGSVGIVTATVSIQAIGFLLNNPAALVSGTTNYNGTVENPAYSTDPVTNIGASTTTVKWQVANSAPSTTPESGTVSFPNFVNGFAIRPMAIISNVCDPTVTQAPDLNSATHLYPCVNGYVGMETNGVTWNVGDVLQVPHFNAVSARNLHLNNSLYTPLVRSSSNALEVQVIGPGWGNSAVVNVTNLNPASSYIGGGGNLLNAPYAISFTGPNSGTLTSEAPLNANLSAIRFMCSRYNNVRDCSKTPGYNVIQLDADGRLGALRWNPATGEMSLYTAAGRTKVVGGPLQVYSYNADTLFTAPKAGDLLYRTDLDHLRYIDNSGTGHSVANLDDLATAITSTTKSLAVTTTAASSDTYGFSGMTSSWRCAMPNPRDSTSAAAGVAYVSSKGTNTLTLTHPATAGLTYDIVCTSVSADQ
jgi:hypothetical protein